MNTEHAVIVVNKTRLEELVNRFNTKAQAKFYIERSGGVFQDYQAEYDHFYHSLETIRKNTEKYLKIKVIDRSYLPNYLFSDGDLVIVVGRDGLVANTAKYVPGKPILAINPDAARYDGILLPYTPENFEQGLNDILSGSPALRRVTMAEARLNDGQRLLAFNDFFIGPTSHISMRYRIDFDRHQEEQSSSGIIVSTGAGSTGWLSSLVNQTNGLLSAFHKNDTNKFRIKMNWEADQLAFVVREPFQSKYSSTSLTAGIIDTSRPLTIESYMPSNGLIFSDGIEADFMHFNSGAIARVGIAAEKAHLVYPWTEQKGKLSKKMMKK